ncbi:MAG TPA: 2OG-Fe(II) oxygenase [Kiloniellales bacterium]|nr:2OG-Fe(II) oxygenase [Kiloniellales bacterium]
MALAKEHEFAPVFIAHAQRNENFAFSTLGGRPVALTFIGSAGHPLGRRVADDLMAAAQTLSTDNGVLCAVTFDRADREQQRIAERPALIVFHDEDLAVAKLYGVVEQGADPATGFGFAPATFLLDERLRVAKVIRIRQPEGHVAEVMQALAAMPRPGLQRIRHQAWAPVLAVPRVFEPEFCRELIGYYEKQGGQPSGFMREREGMTYGMLDDSFKRRRDAGIADKALRKAGRERVMRRLAPAIEQAFMFKATHIERDIVACYDASTGGFFKAHRDNTTRATAHRRFAVTINLNAEDYEGGDLRFPEFGKASYRAETGGAVVFSCALLHEATPVTRGKRYCYLPFLYDEEGARIRRENEKYLDGRVLAADEKTVLYDPAQKAKA